MHILLKDKYRCAPLIVLLWIYRVAGVLCLLWSHIAHSTRTQVCCMLLNPSRSGPVYLFCTTTRPLCRSYRIVMAHTTYTEVVVRLMVTTQDASACCCPRVQCSVLFCVTCRFRCIFLSLAASVRGAEAGAVPRSPAPQADDLQLRYRKRGEI